MGQRQWHVFVSLAVGSSFLALCIAAIQAVRRRLSAGMPHFGQRCLFSTGVRVKCHIKIASEALLEALIQVEVARTGRSLELLELIPGQ